MPSIFICPRFAGSKTEITKFHGAISGEEDVLRHDVPVKDTIVVQKDDGIDELQHEVTNVFGLKRSLTGTDGLVEISVGAVLEDEVAVVVGLERSDEVDNVAVVTDARVDCKFFGSIVNSHGGWTRRLHTLW